jgi:hypothetical protein
MRLSMKKFVSIALSLVLMASVAFSFAGCGPNSPGAKAIDVLEKIGQGDWGAVFDRIHPFSNYTGNRENYVNQMTEHGKMLVEFLKDAKFEVENEQFEKEWSFEGVKFPNVTRVTIKMLPGQTKDWPTDFPFAVSLGQTLRCEALYSDQEEAKGVILNMGKPPLAHWVSMVKGKDEYAAPAPAFIVSDPDPDKPGNPAVASFFWIFDSNYKGKYYAVPVETYTKTLIIAINPEDNKIQFVKQIFPEPNQGEQMYMDAIFKPYEMENVTADTIASLSFMPIPEPAYNPYAMKVREAVAQVLKLYTIHSVGGYGAFHAMYPDGLLAVRKGVKLELPTMIDINKVSLDQKVFGKQGKTAIIKISSCGTCQAKAIEVSKQLATFGLPQNRIIYVSTSPKDKLGDFEKKIGSAHLVIDDKKLFELQMKLTTTPGMIILDKDSKVLAFLESNDLDNLTSLNRALNEAF